MDLKEQQEFIQLVKDELKPNTLPKEFLDALIAPQHWVFQMPMTVNASTYAQLSMILDDNKRMRLQFMLNNQMLAYLDFYAAEKPVNE